MSQANAPLTDPKRASDSDEITHAHSREMSAEGFNNGAMAAPAASREKRTSTTSSRRKSARSVRKTAFMGVSPSGRGGGEVARLGPVGPEGGPREGREDQGGRGPGKHPVRDGRAGRHLRQRRRDAVGGGEVLDERPAGGPADHPGDGGDPHHPVD